MHLVIIHYHLNRGGVTQVILNHLRALANVESTPVERVVVLHGGRKEGWPDKITQTADFPHVQVVCVPGLEYDQVRGATADVDGSLRQQLVGELQRMELPPEKTLIHVHNHSLGKVAQMPSAIDDLARRGYRLLLQVHDFAEDFRPENFRHLGETVHIGQRKAKRVHVYPQGSHVHYAVLSSRDKRTLDEAFSSPNRIHLLPNPVELPATLPDSTDAKQRIAAECGVRETNPLLTYPVRGIRRKNIGEMLLWSAMLGNSVDVAVTIRPRNPHEAASYDLWMALAKELELACHFGIGEVESITYPQIIAASDALLTTSVAEGFGMVFLEASLFGRHLVGRDLPEITADFREQGVRFPWLTSQIRVPAHLVDADDVRSTLVEQFCQVRNAFQWPMSEAAAHAQVQEVLSAPDVDFAILSATAQQHVIQQATSQTEAKTALDRANEGVFQLPQANLAEHQQTLSANAATIEENYGLAASGHRLCGLYESVVRSPVDTQLEAPPAAERILEAFLAMHRLRPTRLQ